MVHVAVEHQHRPLTGASQRADDVEPSLLHLLVLYVHTQALELAAQVFRHRLFLTRNRNDVREIPRHLHEMRAVELIQYLLAVHAIEPP